MAPLLRALLRRPSAPSRPALGVLEQVWLRQGQSQFQALQSHLE